MLLEYLDGSAVTDRSDPTDLIGPLNRIARLRAVKCAPNDGNRGSPTSAMNKNCPPLLLEHEIELLQPRLILTVGKPAERAIRHLPGYRAAPTRGRVRRAAVLLNGKTCTVYSIAHPVSPASWQADHLALMRHLTQDSACGEALPWRPNR